MTNTFQFEISDEASGLEAALGVAMRRFKKVTHFEYRDDGLCLKWGDGSNGAATKFPAPMDLHMVKALVLAWLEDQIVKHDNEDDVWYSTGFKMTGPGNDGWDYQVCVIKALSVEYHK